jgi:hypothetical protein
MISRIVRSRYYIPALIALVIGTEAYSQYSTQNRILKLETQKAPAPAYKDSEGEVRAFAGKLRLCELACYGQVKKFSESTSTCECVEKQP